MYVFQPPDERQFHCDELIKYRVYHGLFSANQLTFLVEVDVGTDSAVINNLLPYTPYQVGVSVVNNAGLKRYTTIRGITTAVGSKYSRISHPINCIYIFFPVGSWTKRGFTEQHYNPPEGFSTGWQYFVQILHLCISFLYCYFLCLSASLQLPCSTLNQDTARPVLIAFPYCQVV